MRTNTNKPRLPVNTTPVRPRDTHQNNYTSGQGLTPTRHENGMYMANLSPNKLNATKKPMPQKGYQGQPLQQYQTQPQQMPNIQIHQRRQSQQVTRPLAMLSKRTVNCCQTHPNREGVFRIESDGEYVYCCNECSHKIANSGFALERVEPAGGQIHVAGVNTILSSRRQSNTFNAPLLSYQSNPPPSHKNITPIQQSDSNIQNFTLQIDPSHRQDPRFFELQDFVEDCKAVYTSFNQNIEAFTKIQDHYADQQRLLQQFYEATIEYMKHIKEEHLNIIRAQGKKYVQIAEIQSGQLEQNKEEIQKILTDISQCIEDVFTECDEQGFNTCMNTYKKHIEMFKHRVQEQRSGFDEISKLEHEELEVKLEEFREVVNDLIGVKEAKHKPLKKEPVREVSVTRKTNTNGMLRNGGNNLGNYQQGNSLGNNYGSSQGNSNLNNGLLKIKREEDNDNRGFNGFGGFNNEPRGTTTGVLGGLKNNNSGATIPKANQNGPFRTLFGDDGTAQSPQFKDI